MTKRHWICLEFDTSSCSSPYAAVLDTLTKLETHIPNSRLEDTITFHLIERVQFALNKVREWSR